MSIPVKDQKILWGKAAGLCSMPDCRKKLVHSASDEVPSNNILFGQNCHIVGESDDGPRGKSILSDDERNRYPNLILLCANHHKIIDEDPSSWPIEKLHQIKGEHELWIETTLTGQEGGEIEKFYADLVNLITNSLCLNSWPTLSDHAVRLLLDHYFVEGVDDLYIKVIGAVWPNKYPELEEKIINLSERSAAYTKHFLTKSKIRGDNFHVEDKWWKQQFNSREYYKQSAESSEWAKKSTSLLFNVVVSLNEFSDSVRKNIYPHYMLSQGKFMIHDDMGVISDFEPTIYIPDNYIDDSNL